MAKIIAAITMSVDGYITGPDDGPDKGLGEGGERLHYWVMGGPWSYESEPQGEPEGEDAAYLNEMTARGGAIVVGRNMYEAAGHWGDKNPFGMPVFVVTHRPEEEPDTGSSPRETRRPCRAPATRGRAAGPRRRCSRPARPRRRSSRRGSLGARRTLTARARTRDRPRDRRSPRGPRGGGRGRVRAAAPCRDPCGAPRRWR